VVVFASMELIPLRLQPSDDLKQSLESWIAREAEGSAWIVSGIGSLTVAQLRLALQMDFACCCTH
jgi:predicted DNA-binding protein with PD1-like motif